MAKAEAKDSVVKKVMRRLRARALRTEPGGLVGSEEQLVSAYGVSRPTLRQAAAMIGQEQLLTVKRGVGGGYFARRPDKNAVAHMASIYLMSRATTLEEIIKAIEPLKVEIATLAAANRDPQMLAELRDFQQRDVADEKTGGFREFLRSERELGRLLGLASRNKVLELFLTTLYDFCASIRPEKDVYRDHPDRVHIYWSRRIELVASIIDGDEEAAASTSRSLARTVSEWMVEDVAKQDQVPHAPWQGMD